MLGTKQSGIVFDMIDTSEAIERDGIIKPVPNSR